MTIAVNENGVPDELKHFRQWVVWKLEQVEAPPKKPTKVPYSPITGRQASSVDRNSWSTFDDAMDAYKTGKYSGIGFVLTKEDPYTVIDLDKADNQADIDKNTQIFYDMASFTEYSPSGTGVHIWTKAEVAKGRNKRPVEIYCNMRFMTVTGNVHWNRPIEYRQDEVMKLWNEIAPKTGDVFINYDGTDPSPYSDQDVLNRAASAKNGYKFTQLWHGNYSEWYSSQSEADFALIDILAFYTQNTEQIARLFRFSELGKRDKALRDDYVLPTIQKAYDKLPPKIDLTAIQQQTAEWIAQQNQALMENNMKAETVPAADTQTVRVEVAPTMPAQPTTVVEMGYGVNNVESPYTFPGGLIGEVADYIYRSSPRPVKEIALSAAIGLIAGIAGNSYNISGLGLNLYLLVLATTGTGKESLHGGMSRLMNTIKPLVPSSELFMGPGDIASPQALINHLASKQRCFVSAIGECGMWLKEVSDPRAPAHLAGLRRALLMLYGRSGAGDVLQSSIYADKAKNTDAIRSPSVTILGETTPERYFDHIDEELIAEGFIPRWTVIEYTGKRPPHNEQHNTVYPSTELITGLSSLCNFALQQMHSLQALNVSSTPEAKALMKAFDEFCDEQINNTPEEAIRNLWTRAHVKAMKLAALVAVGKNLSTPTVTVEDFEWAKHIIMKDVTKMCRRFNAGMLAARVAHNDSEQQQAVIGAIKTFLQDPTVDEKYKIKPQMRAVSAVPHYYLQRKLGNTKAFKNDRRGATTALSLVVKNMMMNGLLTEIPKAQSLIQFGFAGSVYIVSDIDLLLSQSV